LQTLLGLHPKTALSVDKRKVDERESQRQLMAKKRAAARDLEIPNPKEPNRREDLLSNIPELLRFYFADIFYEPFTASRLEQIEAIMNAARYGGDQAVADSRGEGKTTTAMHVAMSLMVLGLSSFPIVIGKSQKKSQMELAGIKETLQFNEKFRDDFPEICYPFYAVGGWSSRARMQTVGGVGTNLRIAADHLIFPTIGLEQLRDDWPSNNPPCSNGQIMASMGVDGPIRGTKILNKRPTIAIIDDMEDREAANSDTLIEKNEEILEQDIAGLGSSDERIPRVLLCTIQNRKCIAYKYTDPKVKPSWRGKRFRKMITQPTRMDLVNQYINMRKDRKKEDPDAREAFRFWKENKEAIESDCIVSNQYSYAKKTHADGEPLELSAIQSYYNRVADVGQKAVSTEIDNDPPEDSDGETLRLTASMVASRLSGFHQNETPPMTECFTVGLDIGKRDSHWVKIAWWGSAIGCIVDYGIMETSGLTDRSTNQSIETVLLGTLPQWRDSIMESQQPVLALVDAGAYSDAVYEFCRRAGNPFYPSKGWASSNFRIGKQSDDRVLFQEAYAHKQPGGQWLYHVHTEHWKHWLQCRFVCETHDENNNFQDGTLSLFNTDGDRKRHHSFSHHIVAEEMVERFEEGKGTFTKWAVRNRNNHWLDATALACAAAGCVGVRLVEQPAQQKPLVKQTTRHNFTNQHGQPYLVTQR
jgi:hypothetical protein